MQLKSERCFLAIAGTSLLLLATIFLDVVQPASIYSPDFNETSAHFLAQQRSCRDLCSFCATCNGFYCGEECICECSQDPFEHAKCIDLIKANSEQLGLVYDVLLQQPQKRSSRTRFGRRAKTAEDDGGKGGFRKILFANFDNNRGATTDKKVQQAGEKMKTIEKMAKVMTTKEVGKDPLENADVVDLLFSKRS